MLFMPQQLAALLFGSELGCSRILDLLYGPF